MREKHLLYEYIIVYGDEIAISAKNPREIIDALTDKHKFKLKVTSQVILNW